MRPRKPRLRRNGWARGPIRCERLNDAWTLVMGGHFHDIAAGTATPKSYEFAWNDDVIAMNQFAGVLNNATEAVAAALNTETKGVPVVVFNPLNIAREDVVEASVELSRRHAEGGARDRPGRQGSAGANFEWQGDLRGQGAIGRLCGLRCAARRGRRGRSRDSASVGELARERNTTACS